MGDPEKILQQIGQNIVKLRKANDLSQEALAHGAGLDRSYLGSVERGERNVGVQNLCLIARALRVSLNALLEGVNCSSEENELT